MIILFFPKITISCKTRINIKNQSNQIKKKQNIEEATFEFIWVSNFKQKLLNFRFWNFRKGRFFRLFTIDQNTVPYDIDGLSKYSVNT